VTVTDSTAASTIDNLHVRIAHLLALDRGASRQDNSSTDDPRSPM